MTASVFAMLLAEIRAVAATATDLAALEDFIVDLIARHLPYYNWTGFYMLDRHDARMLVLGPFRGAPTEHTRIPVDRGICGAAVAQDQTVVIEDVTTDPRYLACSLETRSEIVVPVRVRGRAVGEIDVDSHRLAAFTAGDRRFLEACAEAVGAAIERLEVEALAR